MMPEETTPPSVATIHSRWILFLAASGGVLRLRFI